MTTRSKQLTLPALLAGLCVIGAASAQASDKFKVTSVDCEQFFLMKHTPALNYDIPDVHRSDYSTHMSNDYFREAAHRTVEYCNRTSYKPDQPGFAPRKIRGVWFKSNDGQFQILYGVDPDGFDVSATTINSLGERNEADRRAAAQHQAQLDEIRTRDVRAQEIKAATQKVEQGKAAAEAAREQAFLDRPDLQRLRLGTPVTRANFARLQDVRVNPFHFKKLGVAVVRTSFNRMVTDKVAMFGNELAPIFVHIDDVDRFAKSGETVMLAFRPTERGEVEKSYGSLPEIVLSAIKQEPLFGEYVGAYSCPGDDCNRIFDAPPAT